MIPGLGRPPEKGMATHCSLLAWRILMDRGAWWATIHGVTKSRTRLSDFTFTFLSFGSSAGKESACNVGDPGSISGSRGSPGEGIGLPTPGFLGFPGGSYGKESTCNAGDLVQSLGWEEPLLGGHGNPSQYSCL